MLLRRSALEAVGGWHGDPGYLIDQSTYCRVLLHGDLATAPGTLAAFRLSSTQWSVALAREQARSAAEMHRQVAELAPGLLSSRDVRRGQRPRPAAGVPATAGLPLPRTAVAASGAGVLSQVGLVASRQNSL